MIKYIAILQTFIQEKCIIIMRNKVFKGHEIYNYELILRDNLTKLKINLIEI